MALEIEAKFRVESHQAVRDALEQCGAEALGSVIETNHILDTAAGALRRGGCGLRVRVNKPVGPVGQRGTCVLTFKGPILPGPLKRREEIETEFNDPAGLLQILQALGYLPVLVYTKARSSYRLSECRVELDEVPHLGRFVEIEGPAEGPIARVQNQMGLGGAEHINRSYVGLLLDHCSRAGIDPLRVGDISG